MSGLYNGVNAVGLEPTEFSIGQNYPNPFKDKTVIKYCVAYKSRVQITVYNSEGMVIEKLVDEEKYPGTYEAEFNTSSCHSGESANGGRNLDQGYYFYRMTAGDYLSEKKWLCINKLSGRLNMKSFLQTLFFFLLVTQICFAQWAQLGLGDKTIKDIAAKNSTALAIVSDSSMYRSIDNGSNWLKIVESGALDITITPTGTVFMVKDFPYQHTALLLSSSNNGNTWDTLNVWGQLPPVNCSVMSMNVSVSTGGIVYCGLYLSCFEKQFYTVIASSTDNGLTWTTPGWEYWGGHLFDYKGESVISAGYYAGLDAPRSGWNDIYLSTDNGNSWIDLGVAPLFVGNCHVLSLCLNGNVLLGGSLGWGGSGIFLSTDTCNSWIQVSSLNIQAGLSMESGGTLASTDSLGVFLFNDVGDSLGSRNDGLTNLNIHTLTIDNNNYVYAGTDNGVWRRPLSEITSVEEEQTDEIPNEFLLSQNYPNPFNPSTGIKYQVSSISHVSLVVYDVLGNEIETLVNEEKPAGTYEITWYPEQLPSGVYFYQLKAGDYIETKKMLLIK